METYHYFFMKVGRGNAYLDLMEINDNHSTQYLWVDFRDHPLYCPEDLRKYKPPKGAGRYGDLITLMHAIEFKKHVRVITVNSEHLHIWEIQGPLESFYGHSEEMRIKDLVSKDKGKFEQFKYAIAGDKEKNWSELMPDELRSKHYPKLLPVKLKCKILRSEIPACLSSLRTHRVLNQGTFRALQRIGEKVSLAELEELQYPDLPSADLCSSKRIHSERDLGKFFRILIDELIRREEGVSPQLPADFFWRPQSLSLIAKTFSPPYVETLAMMIIIDLGLIPNGSVGKGMDGVDVIASGKLVSEHVMRQAIQSINEIRGSQLDENLMQYCLDNKILKIQCKAYRVNDSDVHDMMQFKHVIVLHQADKIAKNDLSTEGVCSYVAKNPGKYPLTSKWLDHQKLGLSLGFVPSGIQKKAFG